MPRFAANISFLFTEYCFLDRFQKASELGFDIVECHWPYDESALKIQEKLKLFNQEMLLINTPIGTSSANKVGFAALSGQESNFEASFTLALESAKSFGARYIHVMSGKADYADEKNRLTLIRNLSYAAAMAQDANITLVIEPINNRDMQDYFLNSLYLAADIVETLNHDYVKILFDIYHIQILHGDILKNFEKFQPLIAHVQFANTPFRNEPDKGELNFSYIFKAIEDMGYTAPFAAEYRPTTTTEAGLGWLDIL